MGGAKKRGGTKYLKIRGKRGGMRKFQEILEDTVGKLRFYFLVFKLN